MKSIQIAHPSAAIELIAAARQLTPDWESWGAPIVDVAEKFFGGPMSGAAVVEQKADEFRPVYARVPFKDPQIRALYIDKHGQLPKPQVAAMYRSARVELLSDVLARITEFRATSDWIEKWLTDSGVEEGVAMTCHVANFRVAVFTYFDRPVTLTRDDRRLLTQVSLHIEQALRLRLGQANELAILRPDGKVLHAEGPLEERGARQEMTETVRAIERARSRPTVNSAEIWTGLVRGKLGLSPRQDGSDRHYVVLEHQDPESRLLELSPREMRIVELAAEGLSNKLIAYALGISEPTVSRALGAAALKLGCNGARDLVAALSLLLRLGPKGDTWTERPTPAEQEVLELLRQGLSNAEIAAARGCSTRTVANQVASLLRKAGADSRRAL